MIHIGDLVLHEGYYGIVVRKFDKNCHVFLGNGLTTEVDEDSLEQVLLPGSSATASFHELLKGPKW